jgi:hypothetical protein
MKISKFLIVGLPFCLITATTNWLHATTFTVTTTNISGPGSLSVAIAQANATPGMNQIKFSVTNVVTLGLQLPAITNSVAITGSATVPTVISGGGILPLFTFAAGTTNSLSNLVLANGYATNNGAAISNSSTLSVTSCVITNNSATNRSGGAIFNSGVMAISSSVISGNYAGSGGAIYNLGTMTLNNSMMSGNQVISGGETFGGAIFNGGSLAISILTMSNNLVTGFSDGFGGGIFNQGTTLSISRATFVSNTVMCPLYGTAYGGALHSDSGTVKITNSTFFGNAAIGGNSDESTGFVVNGMGGSVSVQSGNCTLINCTVANNLAMGGAGVNINNHGQGIAGGIYAYSGTVSLFNTIVAGNSASSNSPDLNGAFVSSGVNLIGNNQGATNLSIFDFQNVVANLGTLQNNGGTTLTCAPLPGSLAIGNGISTGAPTTDQRGVPRPQGGAFDIGAVEVVTNFPFVAGGTIISGSGFNLNTIFDSTNEYRVQASTNLTSWVNLITNNSGGAQSFTDIDATNLSHRFYRTATP